MPSLATRMQVSVTVATALRTDGQNGPDSPTGTSLHAPSTDVPSQPWASSMDVAASKSASHQRVTTQLVEMP